MSVTVWSCCCWKSYTARWSCKTSKASYRHIQIILCISMTLLITGVAEFSALSDLESLISSYRFASFQNEDFIFDHDITSKKIQEILVGGTWVVQIIYHLSILRIYFLILWLKKIFNEIIHLEWIPSSFKEAVILSLFTRAREKISSYLATTERLLYHSLLAGVGAHHPS